MDIKVNGRNIYIQSETLSINYLLRHLKIKSAMVVIEKNGVLIDKDNYDTEHVTDGDVVEIVQFVGGG
ncbi:MAG: sulfur carrier protein ThiS [Spirochaetota bacterium]